MNMDDNNCFWPIIYVRGYAQSDREIDATTADPFCGFNLGSTVMRASASPDQVPRKFIFESPLVRLRSDYQYTDVYNDGVDILDPDWEGQLATRSIVIFRYYDAAAPLLGQHSRPPIEDFARRLGELILRVRDLVCENADNAVSPAQFKCYLAAHSMGGLVCRAFLQNPELGKPAARKCVAKLFTYATPHNGISFAGKNVPEWITVDDIDNFNRTRMAKYLGLQAAFEATGRVDWIPEAAFPSRNVFCLIGTNRADYEAAAGLSRTFAGHGSDGLVRIADASICGIDDAGQATSPAACAHVYRSHSGYFGIVNSEEAYQNLVRFLFGDVRVDIWLDIDVANLAVPQTLEQADREERLDALYQIEIHAAPRTRRWYLTRRVAEEDSVACRSHKQLRNDPSARRVYLSSVFLANRFRTTKSWGMAYTVMLGIRVPDYEVDKRFWPDQHFEGGYLFHDAVAVELAPPEDGSDEWKVMYDWQSDNVGQATTPVKASVLNQGEVTLSIPFATGDASPPRSPRIAGSLRFVLSAWNG